MANGQNERKLTAILAADVVGYSALSARRVPESSASISPAEVEWF